MCAYVPLPTSTVLVRTSVRIEHVQEVHAIYDGARSLNDMYTPVRVIGWADTFVEQDQDMIRTGSVPR